MAVRMLVTAESPTNIVLQTNPAYNQDIDKTFSSSLKSGLGCFGVFAILLLFILLYIFTRPLSSLPWYFGVIAVIFFVVLMLFISLEISFIISHRNSPQETRVTIDLDAQQAIRIDTSKSGNTSQTAIKLNEVSRILIDCQAAGHLCKLLLESQNNPSFEVNSAYDFEMEPLKEFGKKLGGLINKPVILRWAEGSKVESEDEI